MRGFILYAVGDKYRKQFEKCATLLKEHHPGIPITVFSDKKTKELDLAEEIVLRTLPDMNTATIFKDIASGMKETPYERTILIDTDVICCRSILDVFRILKRFDIAAVHAPYRLWPCDNKSIPEPFAQFNTGVLGYNKTNEFLKVLDNTIEKHQRLLSQTNEISEQPCFRSAVYESALMPYVLPSEYNFRSRFLAFAQQPIKMIHEEKLIEKDLGDIRERINIVNEKPFTPRAWLPGKGMIYDVQRRKYG